MIYDPAKEGTVKYNYLNLPERVDLGTQGKTYYHYDAAGNKLAKYIENNNSSENTTTDTECDTKLLLVPPFRGG